MSDHEGLLTQRLDRLASHDSIEMAEALGPEPGKQYSMCFLFGNTGCGSGIGIGVVVEFSHSVDSATLGKVANGISGSMRSCLWSLWSLPRTTLLSLLT